MTVANHGFLYSNEVYHPTEEDGARMREIVDRRPEYDVAFMKLTPSEFHKFTNSDDFSAKKPTRLAVEAEIAPGSWSELDGMSSGLVSLLFKGVVSSEPERPLEHPKTRFSEWTSEVIAQVFGAINNKMVDGMCGAPIVCCDTG